MAELYIQAVTITPNPVNVKAQFKIEVEMYTLFPAAALYPALDLYPVMIYLASFHGKIFTQEPMYIQ